MMPSRVSSMEESTGDVLMPPGMEGGMTTRHHSPVASPPIPGRDDIVHSSPRFAPPAKPSFSSYIAIQLR
ncbi:hypothetical protein P5L48_004219 [Escherichia coli]|nr:hypothetical protein [Escherichia coli]